MDRDVMALTHVIAYDISDDHRRAHVAAVLHAYGDRIQRSVFVATVDPGQLSEARERISQIIIPKPIRSTYSGSAGHAGKRWVSTARQPSAGEALYWAVL